MIDVTVKTLDAQNHVFSVEDDQITVRGFKEYIAESVAIPADLQRLIYCGRILQDEKKLREYDVNGKVIHLVQRLPPRPGQSRNDGGQNQGQNIGSMWQNQQRTHYRLTRTQMHGNAMYVGAISVPADIVENHSSQLSSLANSRLIVARRMFDRVNAIVDRLDDPTRPAVSDNNQPPLAQQVQVQQLEAVHYLFSHNESRTNGGTRIAEAAAAAIAAALSANGTNNVTLVRGNSDEAAEAGPVNEPNEENPQPEAQQQQQQPQPQQSQSEQQLSQLQQMGELLCRLLRTQDRLATYIRRYRSLLLSDPPIPAGPGPEGVEAEQRIIDGVSECLHCISHACHAMSDIIFDVSDQPPRNLICNPTTIRHSAILQPDIPIQVDVSAHISVQNRNTNNNNGSEESSDNASAPAPTESNESSTEEGGQQQEAESGANMTNNVQVVMEVSPEDNIDPTSRSEPTQTGENNNNNNNSGTAGGTAGTFPWSSAPPSDFIRNLVQAVTGHMVQGGITTTIITTQNPATATVQQGSSTLDGNTNAGQSTQARSNVGTHPTTATQTRSTSRPHVFQQQTHPLGAGIIGQGFDIDPLLPCNSHHVRRTSTATSNTATSTSQGTRTTQAPTTESQSQTQTATTSSTTSTTSSTNTTPVTTSQTTSTDPIRNLVEYLRTGRRTQIDTSSDSDSDEAHRLPQAIGNLVEVPPPYVGIIRDRASTPPGGTLTLAELMLPFLSLSTVQNSRNEDNFFVNLSVFMLQTMTMTDLIRLGIGNSEPIAHLRESLQEFFQSNFPNTTTEALQEQATEQLLTHLRPHLHNVLMLEEDTTTRNGSRIDICATVEALLRRHFKEILQFLFDSEVTDARFAQEAFNIVSNGGRQLCAVLRYSVRGGQAGLEAIVSRCFSLISEGSHLVIRGGMLEVLTVPYRAYLRHVTQLPDSEIIPLLIYKDVPPQQSTVPSTTANQPSQAQSDAEPMETEAVEERTNFEASVPDDGEEIPETFPGHESLPSDWVPIIARDGVRQRRQLQMQGMNGSVATFSDAYLSTLPTKRRKLIEQQKPRLLVSPTPNHSAIAASMERLVREGVSRAGVEEVEGAAVAVAVDPGVRRAFGQAIRDCLNPRRYGTPDFPDPLRFPNATKYFTDQDRQPK